MFALMSLLKIVGVVVAAMLIGLALMPTDVLFLGLGAATFAGGGIFAIYYQFWTGVIVAGCGVLMFLIGLWVRRNELRDHEESIARTQAAATRASRTMGVYLPPE